MNINLEQSLAAVVRFIQDNSEEGTQWYFDEIPEDFYVPSVSRCRIPPEEKQP